jgi:hypothetical protein
MDEHPEEPGLRLAAETQKEQVVFRENRVVKSGQNRSLVAVDSGEGVLAAGQRAAEVPAQLLLDAAGRVSGFLELTESLGPLGHGALSPANCRRCESFNQA